MQYLVGLAACVAGLRADNSHSSQKSNPISHFVNISMKYPTSTGSSNPKSHHCTMPRSQSSPQPHHYAATPYARKRDRFLSYPKPHSRSPRRVPFYSKQRRLSLAPPGVPVTTYGPTLTVSLLINLKGTWV